MPEYRVTGLGREDGMPRIEKIEAVDKTGVLAIASDRGIVVKKITRLSDEPGTPAPPPAPEPLEPPEYGMLKVAGQVTRTFGVVVVVCGVLLFVALCIDGAMSGDLPAIIAALAPSLSAVLVGVVAAANGEAVLALRDIARNSWR